MDMASETAPYGEWPSPIQGADIARKQVSATFPVIDEAGVWWQESRPAEDGRVTVRCQGPDGISHDLLPEPWNARTRVHEYGGRSYLPVPGGLVFANFADQRLYRCAAGGSARPEPLTPAPGPDLAGRYADLVLSPDRREVWCVREEHLDRARIRRSIVAVPLDGSAADRGGRIRVLVSGSDFYAYPTPSPDGTRLAWICWDHPRMPWDGTELRVAALDAAGPVSEPELQQVVMGGEAESVLAPVWRDSRSLYVVSDRSGWWNLYLADLLNLPRALCPREEEFAAPLWQLGLRPFAVLGDGRLAVTHGAGETRLGVLDPDTGELTDVHLPYQLIGPALAASGQRVVMVAGGPAVPMAVIEVGMPAAPADLAGPGGGQADSGGAPADPASRADPVVLVRAVTLDADSLPEAGYLPVPRAARLTGPSGSVVHALVYPPASPAYTGPDSERPPYIVWVHGGPTSAALPRLDLEKAFFTSRGIGIIDVNYGGSSGYGRAYRERLRGQWGVVDVADVMTAALALAEAGQADGKRLGIRGGSAGGWTALAAVTSGIGGHGRGGDEPGGDEPGGDEPGGDEQGVFAAATSYFGVADLRLLAAQTHDFESRYLDGLVGPLPECEALYAERAPVGHVNQATCPVLLLQGLDDPVVPPAQSESIAAELAAHGIPHAYLTFAGESHGFRKAANIAASLEAELSFYGQVMGFTPPGVTPVPLAGG